MIFLLASRTPPPSKFGAEGSHEAAELPLQPGHHGADPEALQVRWTKSAGRNPLCDHGSHQSRVPWVVRTEFVHSCGILTGDHLKSGWVEMKARMTSTNGSPVKYHTHISSETKPDGGLVFFGPRTGVVVLLGSLASCRQMLRGSYLI